MEPARKSFEFTGTAGGYFVVSIVTLVTTYLFIVGWPIGFNYSASWMADNLLVDGRKLKYSAAYGETFVFLLVNLLLVLVTLGIYMFWFAPKSYRYMVEHTSYIDQAAPATQPQPIAEVTPLVPPVQPVA